jgi:hypothetical protein
MTPNTHPVPLDTGKTNHISSNNYKGFAAMLITTGTLKTISLVALLGCLLNTAPTQAAEELLLRKSL